MDTTSRKEYYKKWYEDNKEERSIYNKLYNSRPLNQERRKQYYMKNKERLVRLYNEKRVSSGWKPKTDWIYTKKICYLCKKEDVPLMQHHKNKLKRQYWICRECNLSASKRYRLTENGRERIRVSVAKSIKKYPRKQRAREILGNAVRTGKVKKPKTCSMCKRTTDIQGHHTNYNKPLEVIWACRTCHSMVHLKQ